MNQKAAYSVLFCALLASTFVHELSAKGVVPVSSRHHHKELLSRAASPETCELSCNWVHTGGDLNITIETINNLFVAVNYVAKAAFVLDASAHIAVVLNGTTGSGVAINFSKQIGISFTGGLWVGSSAELKIFLSQTLSANLETLWNRSGGKTFTVGGIADIQLSIIVNVLSQLVVNVPTGGTDNAKNGLQLLIAISSELIIIINGDLSGILDLIGEEKIDVSHDLTAIVVKLRVIKEIIVSVAGNLTALIKAGVALKLKAILAAGNGLQSLGEIILQLGVVAPIAVALGVFLAKDIIILRVLAALGGAVTTGLNGVFHIASLVADLTNKTVTLELVIQKIIQIQISNSNNVNLVADFNASLEIITQVVAKLGDSVNFSALIKVIGQLKSKALIIGEVNISKIMDTVLTVYKGSQVVLIGAITAVILLLTPIIAIATLAVSFFLTLITSLSTILGAQIAALFNIGTNLDLLAILKNSLSIIVSFAFGDIVTGLSKISIFGTIITSLSTHWSGGAVGFASQLSSKKDYIFAWFEIVVGVKLFASSSAVASVKALIETVTNVTSHNSLSFKGSFSISASASSSGGVSIG